jgi:hypothetical protein
MPVPEGIISTSEGPVDPEDPITDEELDEDEE